MLPKTLTKNTTLKFLKIIKKRFSGTNINQQQSGT